MYRWYDDDGALIIIDEEGIVSRVTGTDARALRNSLGSGRTRADDHCVLAQYLHSVEEEEEEE